MKIMTALTAGVAVVLCSIIGFTNAAGVKQAMRGETFNQINLAQQMENEDGSLLMLAQRLSDENRKQLWTLSLGPFDRDQDGKVSFAEYKAYLASPEAQKVDLVTKYTFDFIDRNRDGEITVDDIISYVK